MNLRPRPHIYDIQRYLLSKNGMLVGSSLRSGETVIEQPTLQGATGFDYGNILDVADSINSNPLDGLEFTLTLDDFITEDEDVVEGYFTDSVPSDPEEASIVIGNRIAAGLSTFKDGIFYMEKYVKETKKSGEIQVYNIKEYQDRILNNPEAVSYTHLRAHET